MTVASARRGGFSLVELLVVMALSVILLGLAVAASNSGAFGSYRIVGAADRVSGWLLIAKQRAVRDGVPTGVRFISSVNTAGQNVITEAQYVVGGGSTLVVPNPHQNPTGGRVVVAYQLGTSGTQVTPRAFYVSDNGTGPGTDPDAYPLTYIQTTSSSAGSPLTLVVPELGGQYALTSTTLGPPAGPTTVQYGASSTPLTNINALELPISPTGYPALGGSLPLGAGYSTLGAALPATLVTYQVGFVVPPTPLFGEPILQFPANTCADPSAGSPSSLEPSNNEIIFTPAGQVLGQTSALVALWVRDPSLGMGWNDYANAGPQSLVVVNTRTGAVSTKAVNVTTNAAGVNDPYSYARDGINDGF